MMDELLSGLLRSIADISDVPTVGAYNIRKDGEGISRRSTETYGCMKMMMIVEVLGKRTRISLSLQIFHTRTASRLNSRRARTWCITPTAIVCPLLSMNSSPSHIG